MESQIKLGDIDVDVVRKRIKNVYLTVNPPAGRVRISAPKRMSIRAIEAFAYSKLDWIKRQQRWLRRQEHEVPRRYVTGEDHLVWGERYSLTVSERDATPRVALADSRILLQVRPGGGERNKRQTLVEAWYREQLRAAMPPLLARWEPLMGVKVKKFFVQRMKTRWGSCNYRAHTIRLNTELASRAPECLEYILVHELVHLLEPSHNAHFHALMDRFMPAWRIRDQDLNRRPPQRPQWRASFSGAAAAGGDR